MENNLDSENKDLLLLLKQIDELKNQVDMLDSIKKETCHLLSYSDYTGDICNTLTTRKTVKNLEKLITDYQSLNL
jgi:hypothetical protein